MAELTKKKLQTLGDLFGETEELEKSVGKKNDLINIDFLVPFENHPFQLYSGVRFDDMVESIKQLGIIQPLIVRKHKSTPNKYEILAGHNRWNAGKSAGLNEVPVLILEDISDDDAMLIVTETNLIQRSFSELLHSERALILSKHHEAIKCQGKRMDLLNEVKVLLNADEQRVLETSRPMGERLNSAEKTGDEYSLSGRTVSRYLRIHILNHELKKFVDAEKIAIRAGVELSYLKEENQLYLVDFLNNNYKVDEKTAVKLRELQKQDKLTESIMESVLNGTYDKPKKVSSIFKSGVKLKSNVIKKYFTEQHSAKEVEETIQKALEMYFSRQDEKAD